MQWKIAWQQAAEAVLDTAGAENHRTATALIGPAGVGKTLLARTVARHIRTMSPEFTVHWVSCTASTRAIPFGAFSHLVDVTGRRDPATTLRAALDSISPAGSDVLVVVDDAHLLDSHSAALVHHLVAVASAHVLVTCRSGEPVPDAITALWKDDYVTRADLTPLTRPETDRLVEHVLDGPVHTETAERIFSWSQGNPLYLRHLVEGAERQGRLRLIDGFWQLRGKAPLTRELADLIDLRLTALTPAVRRVLQYLAVEEPLTVSLLGSLTEAGAIEAAEDSGAVRVVEREDDIVVYSGHPLYVERLRQSTGHLAARRLRTDVVRSLGATAAASVSDRLRIIALALDSDLPPQQSDLVQTAFEALYLNDLPLTERLARAAVQRVDGAMARVALAHALCWQGRGVEAESTLAALDPDAMTQSELLAWVLARASNQFWVLGDATGATEWLRGMRAKCAGKSAQLVLDGLAAQFAMNTAELGRCRAWATRVLTTEYASDEAVAWAASSAALACARSGSFDEVDGLARRCLQTRSPDGVRYTAGLAQTQTAILRGRVDAAFGIATDYLTSAGFRPGRAQAQVVLGHAMTAQGNLVGAVDTLRQAATHYSDTGDAWQSLHLSLLATALGQQGKGPAAAAASRRAQETHDMRTALHRPELHQGRAWALAAARNIPGAIAAAREAVEDALRTGQLAQALLAHHDVIRFGDGGDVRAISRLVDQIDCALGRFIAAQARGLAERDGTQLHRVARDLEAIGLLGAAADAAAQAATAFAARNLGSEEINASRYAARLQGRCSGLRTPALEAALRPLPLTGREHEIALMVAEGRSNKDIAEGLSISVRTVEAHVYRACAKLDVDNRERLGDAVRAATTA